MIRLRACAGCSPTASRLHGGTHRAAIQRAFCLGRPTQGLTPLQESLPSNLAEHIGPNANLMRAQAALHFEQGPQARGDQP